MFSLTGKVAIVTGAARGIGYGIAELFARQGATVCVVDRNQEAGEQSVAQLRAEGLDAAFFECDLTNGESIASLVSQIAARFGGIDIVVHNAGMFIFKSIADLTMADIDVTLDLYLKAAFHFAQQTASMMTTRGRGRLLFTSSVTGNRVAAPYLSHYAAAKAGLTGFVKSAAIEYARTGITVNTVEPGWIKTQAWDGLASEEELAALGGVVPVGRMGRPSDIAAAMLFLASDEAEYITGQTIVVDGGVTLVESQDQTLAWYAEG